MREIKEGDRVKILECEGLGEEYWGEIGLVEYIIKDFQVKVITKIGPVWTIPKHVEKI